MATSTRDDSELEHKAEQLLNLYDREFLPELDFARQKLSADLRQFRFSRGRAGAFRAVNHERVNLRRSVAYFEQYILPLIEMFRSERSGYSQGRRTLVAGINGNWRAEEFQSLFASVDFFYNLFAVGQRAGRRGYEGQSGRGGARLAALLPAGERLQVRQVYYGSPGAVTFTAELGSVVEQVREFFYDVVGLRLVREAVENASVVFYERKARRTEIRKRELEAESALKAAARQLQEQEENWALESLERERRALEELSRIGDLVVELHEKGVVEMDVLEEGVLGHLAMLNRLAFAEGKLHFLPAAEGPVDGENPQ